MGDPNARKKKLGEGAVKAIFTCAVIAFALVMFLISDSGRRLLSGNGATADDAPAEPVATETLSPARITPDAFAEALSLEECELGPAVGGKKYDASDLCASSVVTLAVNGGVVDAFSIELELEGRPEALASDATAIERDIFEDRLAEYELRRDNFRKLFIKCADLLDAGDALPSVEAERLAEMALDTSEDGKKREDTLCGFSFSVYVSGEDDELVTAILSYR